MITFIIVLFILLFVVVVVVAIIENPILVLNMFVRVF